MRVLYSWRSWFTIERECIGFMGDVDGGSTPRLEGHGVHTSIGLILGMQQSSYGGGNAVTANADATPITALGEQANPASC